ncbi:MAG: YihY/virulence factor BrkB family protein [Tepidisphaeraceae bacterium]
MARLRDVPSVLRHCGPFSFLKRLNREISEDNLYTWASALAYSWLFAIFPFLLFLLSLIPLLKQEWKEEAVRRIDQVMIQLPMEAYHTVQEFIGPKLNQLLYAPPKGIWSVGLLVTIWAASGGMSATMAAMDKTYDVPETRPFWIHRPVAVGLTIIVATLILVVIVLIPIGTIVTNVLTEQTDRLIERAYLMRPTKATDAKQEVSATSPAATQEAATQPVWRAGPLGKPAEFQLFLVIWQVARFALALLLLLTIVALIYHFGPNVKQRWRLLTPGSVFTVGVWLGLGVAFRMYVDRYGKYGETYGAVGGVIILMFFFYLDALVLLVGSEINSEIDAIVKDMTGKKDPPTQQLLDAAGVRPPDPHPPTT